MGKWTPDLGDGVHPAALDDVGCQGDWNSRVTTFEFLELPFPRKGLPEAEGWGPCGADGMRRLGIIRFFPL